MGVEPDGDVEPQDDEGDPGGSPTDFQAVEVDDPDQAQRKVEDAEDHGNVFPALGCFEGSLQVGEGRVFPGFEVGDEADAVGAGVADG